MDSFEVNDTEIPVITKILHKHAEESISDEKVERILRPILARIKAGEFDKSRDTVQEGEV